jgi:hypothetical protein
MRANDKDKLLGTETFSFLGRSVFNLTNEVAKKVGLDMSTITLCVHAGFHGRLTPLVVDLPRNEDPLDLVVLPNSSPGENLLLDKYFWICSYVQYSVRSKMKHAADSSSSSK